MNKLIDALVEWARESEGFGVIRFLAAVVLIGFLMKAIVWAWS